MVKVNAYLNNVNVVINKLNLPNNRNIFDIYTNVFYPTKLEFGKKYYVMYNGELTAVKILAICPLVNKSLYLKPQKDDYSFYVQIPNSAPFWSIWFSSQNYYASKEDYITSYGRNKIDFGWKQLKDILQLGYIADYRVKTYQQVFMISENMVKACDFPKILTYFYDKNGINIIYDNTKDGNRLYLSEKECAEDLLNNLKINDFDDDNVMTNFAFVDNNTILQNKETILKIYECIFP